MAATIDVVTHLPSTSGGVSDTISASHTCGAGTTRLQVFTGWGNTGGPFSDSIDVTYNGVALTREGTGAHAGNWSNVECHYMDNPPTGGAFTVSANHNGGLNPSMMVGTAISIKGSKTGTMPDNINSANPGSSPASVTIAGSANGDLTLAAFFTDGSGSSTVTQSPFVEIDTEEDIAADSDYECSKHEYASGANDQAQWTFGGPDNYAAFGVAIQAAAAAVVASALQKARMVARQRVLQRGNGRIEMFEAIPTPPMLPFLPVDNAPQVTGAQNVPSSATQRYIKRQQANFDSMAEIPLQTFQPVDNSPQPTGGTNISPLASARPRIMTVSQLKQAPFLSRLLNAVPAVINNAFVAQLSAAVFQFVPQNLTWLAKFQAILSAAVFQFIPQSLTWLAQFKAVLSTAVFQFSPQNLAWFAKYTAQLTAAVFTFTGQALIWTVSGVAQRIYRGVLWIAIRLGL